MVWKLPWWVRMIFVVVSVLAFALPLNNIFALTALGITGVIGALDLVIKGLELVVDFFRFLEVGIRNNIITRLITD
jgi:hypothetical protein